LVVVTLGPGVRTRTLLFNWHHEEPQLPCQVVLRSFWPV